MDSGQGQTQGPSWAPGEPVVLREVFQDRVWSARPVTVVVDSGGLVAFYLALNTNWKRPVATNSVPLRVPDKHWLLADATWIARDELHLSEPGASHVVIAMWTGRGKGRAFEGWKVNFQEPLRRTLIGFDYLDQALDLIISPDLSTWWWKDRDELAMAESRGILSAGEVWAEADEVVERLANSTWAHMTDWSHWSPDPAWPIPELAHGWRDVTGTQLRH
jgi:uncharacterized protein